MRTCTCVRVSYAGLTQALVRRASFTFRVSARTSCARSRTPPYSWTHTKCAGRRCALVLVQAASRLRRRPRRADPLFRTHPGSIPGSAQDGPLLLATSSAQESCALVAA
jgi:hypothetical protein